MPLFWLSFADPKLTKGDQFLGVALLESSDALGATRDAWRRGVNPGGEVMIVEIPFDQTSSIPDSYMNRLLDLIEVKKLVRHMETLTTVKMNREL